jgi:hypothetical protein
MEKKSATVLRRSSIGSGVAALRRQLDDIERYERKNITEAGRLDEIKKQCDKLQKESLAKLSATEQKQLDAHKHKEYIIKRSEEINEMMKELKDTESVDVCFLIDCTSSMQKYIKEVKDRIFETINLLKSRFPHLNIRLAFIGYRDLDLLQDKQFSILDFTDENEFHSFVSMVKCENGGDACEDVLGGLQKTLKLNWKHPVRILIHVGDCPSHGRRYHTLADVCDYYVTYDNDGSIGHNYIQGLIELRVKYFFGRLTHYTDKMIEQFSSYAENRMKIEQIELDNVTNLLPFIVASVSHSISKATSVLLKSHSMIDANHQNPNNTLKASIQRSLFFDEQEPIWSNIPSKQVQVVKYQCNNELHCKEVVQSCNIKIASNPFAQGGMRLAYHGLMQFKDNWGKVVFKEYKFTINEFNTKDKYLELLDCQTIADYLAQEFNKLPLITNATVIVKKIKFIMTKLVFDPIGEGKYRYLTMEQFIEGPYKKFSNNAGYVNIDDPALTLQAFSHWTYERTNGDMLVVDLQGIDIGDNQTYLLTDPCIHSTDLKRFGRTNLGKPGMKRFFETHVCNVICHALKLKRNKYQPETKTSVHVASVANKTN